jgi:lysyl endopeptidase
MENAQLAILKSEQAMRECTHVSRAMRSALALWSAITLISCGGGGGDTATASSQSLAAGTGSARIEPYERVITLAVRKSAPALPSVMPSLAIELGSPPAQFTPTKASASLGATDAAIARQIGAARAVSALATPEDAAGALAWQVTAAGGLATAARLRSEGAAGLRLGLEVRRLPPSAQVRVRPSGSVAVDADTVSGQEILDTLARNRDAGDSGRSGRTYWMPAVAGESITLEIELPPGVEATQVEVAVPQLSHLWWTHAAVAAATALKLGEAGACNADATCSPAYDFEARSIARMEYVRDGGAYLCTGTLMADVAASGTPYFLGANHCVGDQTSASTLSTYWFYRAATCNSSTLDPAATRVTGGATLLYASSATDTAFMVLRGSPPAGTVHAGSLLAPVAVGTSLAGLHHPAGDLLKLSVGSTPSYANCADTRCASASADNGNFLILRWSSGTTESGSSGSPVFASIGSRRYVVGQLFAGVASCTRPDGSDFYGRFDRAYAALRTWLGSPPTD